MTKLPPHVTPAKLTIGFVAALGLGFVTAYGILRWGTVVAFEASPDAGIMMSWLSPLGGLAAFGLVYGLGRGRAMRALFWVLGPLVVYGAAGVGVLAVAQGATLLTATIVAAVLVVLAGLVLLVRDGRHV